MTIGDRIMQTLQAHEISQTTLAARLKIPVSTLNGYITGRYIPDCDKLGEIACALRVTTDYLLGVDDETALSKDELELISRYRGLNKSNRKVALEHLRFLGMKK